MDHLNEHRLDILDLIADMGVEDAIAHAVTLCDDAGIRCSWDDVIGWVEELACEEFYDDPIEADDWAEERGLRLMGAL